MKLKALVIVAAAALTLSACGNNKTQEATTAAPSAVETTVAASEETTEAVKEESKEEAKEEVKETSKEAATETKTLECTMDEIKDFMFTVVDADKNAYVFPIDEKKPVDLKGIKVGDKIAITYTGELNMTDNFTGEIISVEKAK